MKMALLSLIITAVYLGLIGNDQQLACNVAPIYLAAIVAVWWIGRQLERSHRA